MEAVLMPNVMAWFGVALVAGVLAALWLGRRRRPAGAFAALMAIFAAVAAAVPPVRIPTPGGPGPTSGLESLVLILSGALGLAAGWITWRLALVGWPVTAVMVVLPLFAFGLSAWGVYVSLPHQFGG